MPYHPLQMRELVCISWPGRAECLHINIYLNIFVHVSRSSSRDATTTSQKRQFSHFSRWLFVVVSMFHLIFAFRFCCAANDDIQFSRNDFDIIRTQNGCVLVVFVHVCSCFHFGPPFNTLIQLSKPVFYRFIWR